MAAPRNNIYGAIPITQPNPRGNPIGIGNASLSLHARRPGVAAAGALRVAAADETAPAEVNQNQNEAEAAAESNSDSDVAMVLTQDDLNRLSALVGKNLLTRDDLISQVTFLTCVSVDGVKIPIEPGLLSRLKSRCYKQEFPQFLREVVTKQLHTFCGW